VVLQIFELQVAVQHTTKDSRAASLESTNCTITDGIMLRKWANLGRAFEAAKDMIENSQKQNFW